MNKPTNIRITVSEDEYKRIRVAAAYTGVSIREFVKQAAIEKLERQERERSIQSGQ